MNNINTQSDNMTIAFSGRIIKKAKKRISLLLVAFLSSVALFGNSHNILLIEINTGLNNFAIEKSTIQQNKKRITGKVTDSRKEPIIGANIIEAGTSNGTVTDIDGNFLLEVNDNAVLKISYIGFKDIDFDTKNRSYVEIVLEEDTKILEEIVVTGVAKGTSKEKLSFTVEKVSNEVVKEVPGLNVASTLSGKMPGIKVFSTTGNPMDEPIIQLRGTTSFTGTSQPLIIIDGIITSGVLKDINMEDVESIEVIKGAAAASFYGSKAAGGVVNIITKRGGNLESGTSRVSLKSEIGANWIGFLPSRSTAHGNLVDEDGEPTRGVLDEDQIWDNKYKMTHNSFDDFFIPRIFNSTTAGITSRSRDGDMNYYTSIQYTHNPGIVRDLDGVKRHSFRVNLDNKISNTVSLNLSNLYVRTINDRRSINFDDIYYADPNANFFANNLDGTPYKVNPNIVSTRNNINPLYDINNKIQRGTANRFLGSYGIRYMPTMWSTFNVNYNLDYFHYQDEDLIPKGRLLVNYPDGSIRDDGYVYKGSGNTFKHNLEVSGLLTKTFSELTTTLKLQYLYEDSKSEGLWGNGSKLAVSGMNNTSLELADPETRDHSSWGSRIVSNSYTAVGNLDYKGKYIIDGLVRRDGASVIGDDNMWQTYYRISGAWNVTGDFTIPYFQMLKPRISYGTAGILPSYGAKYETFSLSNGTLYGGAQLGNKKLKPALSQELEIGIDMRFLNQFDLSYTYSNKRNTDLPYVMTVSGVTGFQFQNINIGEFFVHSHEVSLNANLLKRKDWRWDATLTWDKLTEYVGELGRPDFTIGYTKVASNEKYGNLYSSKFATSLDQVKMSPLIKPGQSVEDVFTINNYGYVVRKDLIGTRDEAKMSVLNENGATSQNEFIGNMLPDFNVNLMNILNYKNWMFYFTLSWQQGGVLYNNTKVYMSFAGRNAAFWDMSERTWERKKPMSYLNQHSRASFTEDATFLKMREMSLNYNINKQQLQMWGISFINNIKCGVVGRNLFTLTKYSGPDPETRTVESGTLNGSDTPKYPSDIRTITGTVTIEF
ncbi:MAG: SusC/RagA family TonB-linked outer membrane protein [Proteiniphilum sp.]|nr:SusC/RagA family TonB-linked outer membrane protein [Proteiniphilum sp.]MDD3909108.1 SusC/RagA family TonB-linked outer membrane protein [Proteiniphilum sp.]MDD4415503.1 SusC/RagA family TonB-linked outer membrane protein [Proteiniphilum sp.]